MQFSITTYANSLYNHFMDRFQMVEGVGAFFITFSVTNWIRIFTEEEPIQILIDNLRYCIEHKNLRINSFVIMPDHFHAIVLDANYDNQNLHLTLTNFRKFTGRKLADYVDHHFPSAISARLHEVKVTDRDRRFWQHGWHSEGIFSREFFQQKMDYIHMNPCRKGMVESPWDWKYSSAKSWLDGTPTMLPLTIIDW